MKYRAFMFCCTLVVPEAFKLAGVSVGQSESFRTTGIEVVLVFFT